MKFYSKAFFIIIGIMTLSACEEGGTYVTGGQSEYTYSGRVADGYLQGATVCLDQNINSICDPDEPFTVTGYNGNYSLSSYFNTGVILVNVPATAIDEDTGQIIGEYGYLLKAPLENSQFISPISTMIQSYIDGGRPRNIAIDLVANDLGILDSNKLSMDFISDYSDPITRDQLHKSAVLMANIARERTKDLANETGSYELTQEQKRIAYETYTSEIKGIPEIIRAYNQANLNANDLRDPQIVELIKLRNPTIFN